MPAWIDGKTVLDGVVGRIATDGALTQGAAADPVTTVHITGDLADEALSMGLADDIRRIVTAFLLDPCGDPEPPGDPTADDAGVVISLPGMPLDVDASRVLMGRIRRCVAEHTSERTAR